jgi:hypothetical protein
VVESFPKASRRMILRMKEGMKDGKHTWSVEALYALVFAVCVLLALIMLAT